MKRSNGVLVLNLMVTAVTIAGCARTQETHPDRIPWYEYLLYPSDVNARLDPKRKTLAQLQDRMTSLDATLRTRANQLDELQRESERADTRARTSREQRQQMEREIAGQKEDLARVQGALSGQKTRLQQLQQQGGTGEAAESERERLQQEITQLEKQSEFLGRAIDRRVASRAKQSP